jgi:hypothetical protein
MTTLAELLASCHCSPSSVVMVLVGTALFSRP